MIKFEDFITKIKETDDTFLMKDSDNEHCHSVVQSKFNDVKLVFIANEWSSFPNDITTDGLTLYVIIKDNKMYIRDPYIFALLMDTTFDTIRQTKDCIVIDDYINFLNDDFRKNVFPAWYEALSIIGTPKDYTKIAREQVLLYGNLHIDFKPESVTPYNGDNCMSLLTGVTTQADIIDDFFDSTKESIARDKNRIEATNKLILSGTFAEQYEINIAHALHSVDAVNVTVTFKNNGKNGTAKMDKDVLLRTLTFRETIWKYSFVTRPEGERLFKELGCSGFLEIIDIDKITYRGKTLYSKSSVLDKSKQMLDCKEVV